MRRFHDTDLFEQIFYRILREAMKKGLVDPSIAFIDSTHVKANANKKKLERKIVRVETKVIKISFMKRSILIVKNMEKSPYPYRIKKKQRNPRSVQLTQRKLTIM
ncbi:hypothetical protein ACEQPO_19245 [Bacillus sp. SL00103]